MGLPARPVWGQPSLDQLLRLVHPLPPAPRHHAAGRCRAATRYVRTFPNLHPLPPPTPPSLRGSRSCFLGVWWWRRPAEKLNPSCPGSARAIFGVEAEVWKEGGERAGAVFTPQNNPHVWPLLVGGARGCQASHTHTTIRMKAALLPVRRATREPPGARRPGGDLAHTGNWSSSPPLRCKSGGAASSASNKPAPPLRCCPLADALWTAASRADEFWVFLLPYNFFFYTSVKKT